MTNHTQNHTQLTRAEKAARTISSLHVTLVAVFLYLPLAVLVLYSFSAGRFALRLEGFSLQWYARALANPRMYDAVATSFSLAFASGTVATILGTGLALALHRRTTKTARALTLLGSLPLLVPEIVVGLGLLLFLSRYLRPALTALQFPTDTLDSFTGVLIGHVTLAVGYVMFTVRARLAHFDDTLVLAAYDLGASRWQAFTRVTFPQILPAVLSALFLAFGISLDDFYVSYFVSVGGSSFQTLPLYFWNLQGRQALTPEINVVSTLLLASSALFLALGAVLQRVLRTPDSRPKDTSKKGTS